MTNKELIKFLDLFDDDDVIVISDEVGSTEEIVEVGTINGNPAIFIGSDLSLGDE